MYTVYLVEDDYALAGAMQNQLKSYGIRTVVVRDFQKITEEFLRERPHLVLMDIMLPYKDGYYWCNELRKVSSVPVVFISSASDNMNIVMAINMGGDDFIAKPVDPMVLTAKVQAVLRRTYEMVGDSTLLPWNDAALDLSNGTLLWQGNTLELTKNEWRILQMLLENKGRIVSRDRLMMKLWQSDCYVEENTLTVNVGRLRKKLEAFGLPQTVVTKPGSGYMIE